MGQYYSIIIICACALFMLSPLTLSSCASFDSKERDSSDKPGIRSSADSDAESNSDGEIDSLTEPDRNSTDDIGLGTDTASDAVGDTDVGGDTDTNDGTESDAGADTDTGIDTGMDTGPDAGGDSDSNVDTDTETLCGAAVTTCISGDGCCPSTCSISNDNDCKKTNFEYSPSNFDPGALSVDSAPQHIVLNCEAVFDSSEKTSFYQWCEESQPPVYIDTKFMPEAVILTFVNLTITSEGSLRLIGDRPVILAVFGDATIDGVIDASASDITPGAGGNLLCGNSEGGDGTGNTANWNGASGGGGGGFGTFGGTGGNANTDNVYPVGIQAGGSCGETRGEAYLVPLIGGCPGGRGGDCSKAGGAGGGAVQISAAGRLIVNGTVKVNGGDGATPCGADAAGGGTGGGSGGGILLEASSLDMVGSTLEAKGGNGGLNGTFCGAQDARCGISSGGAGSISPSDSGGNGSDSYSGSPGGGGGYGRIVVATR